MQSSICVHHLPSSPRWREKNLYITKLTEELEKQGIQIDYARDQYGDYLTRALINHTDQNKIDILHFHWTSYQYAGTSFFSVLFNLLKFMIKVKQAKKRGYKIVWTMHNYLPHETHGVVLHYLERLWMAHQADIIIVHAKKGKEILAKRLFRKNDVYMIPHGNYIPFFKRTPQSKAKQSLGITNHEPFLLYFGYLRAYKGVLDLLQAFQELPELKINLCLVGNAAPSTKQVIERIVENDVRIKTDLRYVTDEELALYLSAADIAVLPYHTILGSGALMTALSLGCPVIAPAIGAFSEILDVDCGYLYPPGQKGLQSALKEIPHMDLQYMSEKALEQAERYPWQEMTRQIVNLYQYLFFEKEFGNWVKSINS